MTAGEAPRTYPPYQVEETDRPGVYAVLGDVGGVSTKFAEVTAVGGRATVEQHIGWPRGRFGSVDLVALSAAVNERIREVWPR